MRVAHKLVYYGIAFVPFALVFYLCRGYFPGWPPPDVMLAYIMSLIFSFLLGFFLEATIGMIGFWFLEVSSLLFVYMLFNFFFSGHMFPLDMLPAPWNTIVQMIPLQYLAYFPAAVFLQKIQGHDLWIGSRDRSRLGAVFHRCLPRDVSARREALQRVWRVRNVIADLDGGSERSVRILDLFNRHVARLNLLPRLPHVRPQQPRAGHDVPGQLHHRIDFVVRLGDDECRLLSADLRIHEPDQRRQHEPATPGTSISSSCSSPRRCSSTASCRCSS